MAALSAMTRSADAVIGDSANVAFRLAGLAGRHGRAAVMVTSGVHRAVATQFKWGEGEHVEIKGRRGTETVFPVIAREAHETASPGGLDDFTTRRIVVDPEGNSDPGR
jgi:adenylate cyclase